MKKNVATKKGIEQAMEKAKVLSDITKELATLDMKSKREDIKTMVIMGLVKIFFLWATVNILASAIIRIINSFYA